MASNEQEYKTIDVLSCLKAGLALLTWFDYSSLDSKYIGC